MITANIATFPARRTQLKRMIESIEGQFDIIRVCLNGYEEVPQFIIDKGIDYRIPDNDLKDNGKFMFVDRASEDEIYCTLDDDILYPNNYADVINEAMSNYPESAITFHGRVLSGKHKNYYKAPHKVYRFLNTVKSDVKVDVAGTGVSAFKVFKGLEDIPNSSYQKMSDILFSLNCSFQNKDIVCINHKAGWLKHIDSDVAIFEDMKDNDYPQAILCGKIFELNNQ